MSSTIVMLYYVLVVLLSLMSGGLCTNDTYLYFVDTSANRVYRIDPAQAHPQRQALPVDGLENPLALGYDEEKSHLYVFNGRPQMYNVSKFILKYDTNTGTTERLDLLRSVQVGTVAVDSASGLLYYADRTEKVITAVTTDFRYQASIINSNLDQPSDIALNTVDKEIYWCDYGENFLHIGKANMDGSSRRNIVTKNLVGPNAIAFDIQDKKIYWVDRLKIKRCNTDGTKVDTFLWFQSFANDFFSVALDDTSVYWIQHLQGGVYRLRKDGAVKDIERVGTLYPYRTTDYRSLRLVTTSPPQPNGTNACSGRGGCDHICIPISQSHVCRCSDGYILQPDGTSCQESSFTRGVVGLDINIRALIVLDLDTNITRKITDTWYSDPMGITLDETTYEIFWSDKSRRSIFKTCIPAPCFKVIKTYARESYLGDLAFDTQKRNIYVSDSGRHRITKLSYSGTDEETIIQFGFSSTVIQMALDTKFRKIYWATEETIQVANMDDGSDRRQLHTVLNLGGLALDVPNQKLYMLRYDANRLEVIDLMHNDTRQLVYQEYGSGTSNLAGLALGDGMLYFSNRSDSSLNELNIATKEINKYGQNKFRRIFSLVYFNRSRATYIQTTPAEQIVSKATTERIQNGTIVIDEGPVNNETLVIALCVSCACIFFIIGMIIMQRHHLQEEQAIEANRFLKNLDLSNLDLL